MGGSVAPRAGQHYVRSQSGVSRRARVPLPQATGAPQDDGPALGHVAGVPTMAGGAEYGDELIDEMNTAQSWIRRQGRFVSGEGRIGHILRYKREYVSYATVPHYWFPMCNF